MTLPYSPSRAVYEGNGAATAFPFAFKVWNADQLNVSVTSPQGGTSPAQGWSVSLGESGGTVTYLHEGEPLPAGWRLAIVRNMPFAQGIDLVSASRFDPQVIEDGLDQATAELQQLNEKIARAVILPATSDQSPEEVVQSIYASRDTAAHSAANAEAQAAAAAHSAQAANEKADESAASAAAAAQSAAEAEAASGGLAPRMDAAEQKNAQQDARLDGVESNLTQQNTLITNAETALAGKANTELDNLTPSGTTAIAHYAMPSERAINLAWTGGAVNAGNSMTYIAPADGFVHIWIHGTAGSWLTLSAGVQSSLSFFNDGYQGAFVPVKKGRPVSIGLNVTEITYFKFWYAEGAY